MEGLEMETVLPIVIAVVLGLLTLIILKKLIFGGSKGNQVLLTGLSGSGKTLFWSKLVHDESPVTVTSQKENRGSYTNSRNKVLDIVDIPGFDKVRYTVLNKYRTGCKAIIFVIDAVSLQKDIRDAAEYLYNILADDELQRSRPKLQIFCNKQDIGGAKSPRAVQTLLEKEITILRETRASRLIGTSDSGDSSNNNSFLGIVGKDFEFSDLGKKQGIDFVEGSAVDEGGLNSAKAFIDSL
ncbi:unnamed protein product [Notodromas monacha]|uniref:Signal recognition particle receptor subunit beta n=1 Tax=Notodromas monacha TaxID=399045 RepID=A0A7R9BRE1_9CRUS|nr:unnamed protein product [Notodromas monacha]CAG0919376.1 unnamed protein product [Notodromas monacha]